MSSAFFAQFLFLVGLYFINVLCHGASTGPSQRFAERLDKVPKSEFYDILITDSATWFAGNGLFRLSDGMWFEVVSGKRITAIAQTSESNSVYYSASGKLSFIRSDLSEGDTIDLNVGYVWELINFKGKLWYFGSEGFGWVYTEPLRVGDTWQRPFHPRPLVSLVSGPEERLFISAFRGLCEVTFSGCELVLSEEFTHGRLIPWMDRIGSGILIGASKIVYEWSGNRADTPIEINSDYSNYFDSGMNNSVNFGDSIAIVEYPGGVVLWNAVDKSVSDYISNADPLGLGDVYKVEKGTGDDLLILGTKGVAKADLSLKSKFFPADEIYSEGRIRSSLPTESGAMLFSDKQWIEVNDSGYRTGNFPRTVIWEDLDAEGIPVHGAVNAYEKLVDGKWILSELPIPVYDLKWGAERAYALGSEGLYHVSPELEMELVYANRDKLTLLGELGDSVYTLNGDGRLIRTTETVSGWESNLLEFRIKGELVDSAMSKDSIWLATAGQLYRFDGDKLDSYKPAQLWEFKAICAAESRLAALMVNPSMREWAVAEYVDDGSVMLSIPFKEYVGEPTDIVINNHRVGIIGSNGLGWYHVDELPRLPKPSVEFALLFENKRLEDRTIPSGMHFIDLQVSFRGPVVPSRIQYRINEQRWRNVNLQDPSLQFAGHGSFTVELRAVHPNGNVSPSKVVQFGIAPPWYLNPLYQGLMLLIAIIFVWALYFLRSRQLKRTNLWLQNEVKKQTRELEAASAARTNFLAGLSHDIRNPLNGVLMIAETLSRKPPESGDDQRLKDLTEFGIIVDRMLGEILDFSAIDQENIPTAFIPVSITDIIESSVKQNQFGFQHQMVTLQTSIDQKLKDVVIRTDRNWMIKVLSNLIINALEYSESERVEVGAKCIRISDQSVELELFVTDWGIGIDDSEKELVFERFYRGESGIESGKHGTGLGLSICQEIAHAMGGHIRIENNDPSGCRFVLMGRFDRVEGSKELDKEAVLAQLTGKHILIVDDLVYNRRSIVEFFNTLGCTCDEADNGREASQKLKENKYHLALLDWDLPGLTGPEIARRHRKNHPEDPVILIAVTAYTDGEKKRESEQAGMNGYISKPLTATRLAHCLANIQNLKPEIEKSHDIVDSDEVMEEIYKHIEDCLHYGEHYEWENLRRCAHRLTTLAMIKNNRAMQQVCRDLQIAAQEGNMKESQVELLELQKWRRP